MYRLKYAKSIKLETVKEMVTALCPQLYFVNFDAEDRQYHYSEIQVPPPPAHGAEACRGCLPCCTCCTAAARLQNLKLEGGREPEGGRRELLDELSP